MHATHLYDMPVSLSHDFTAEQMLQKIREAMPDEDRFTELIAQYVYETGKPGTLFRTLAGYFHDDGHNPDVVLLGSLE